MGRRVQKASQTNAQRHHPFSGAHPRPCRKPCGRLPRPCVNPEEGAEAFVAFIRGVFPSLGKWFDALPDVRRQELCKYSGAHIWFQVLMMFITRAGSCNAFDLGRNSGAMPANLGDLCGQKADDPRFGGTPTVTCGDNASRHARRTDPEPVAEIPHKMIRLLLKRRLFDPFRLFGVWHVLLVDGTVHEKCRKGFTDDGTGGGGSDARFRYVVQLNILGPNHMALPFLHEAVDMQNPQTDKEDCELEAFKRLMPRLKALFPRLSFCFVGDALYACAPVTQACHEMGWKYCLTLKEGRQPSLWDELLALLPLHPGNRLRCIEGVKPKSTRRDFRWVEDLAFGESQRTHVILEGDVAPQAATLYAWITNFGNLTAKRVWQLVNATGRKRHCIEDHFNAQKNNGVGLEHVFCADTVAAKNYYSLMQIAEIIWQLLYGGHLARLYEWARRSSQKVVARALAEGFRTVRLPAIITPLGQLRFVT